MTIKHFELAAADHQLTFSPFCWRTKMALKHKQLEFETTPWFFSDKTATQESGSEKVPVINDNGTWVSDSWEIIQYLDKNYPDSPAIIPNKEALALAKLVDSLCVTHLFPALVPIVLTQVHSILAKPCQVYFRETREAFFGTQLENITIDEQTGKDNLNKALSHFDTLLEAQPFICGNDSGYADYILYGMLKWADVVSRYEVLVKDSIVSAWFERMDTLFNGFGQQAKTVRA